MDNVGRAFGITFLSGLFWILSAVEWLVLIWVVISWVVFFMSRSQGRWKYRKLYTTLETLNAIFSRVMHPLLKPFRRILPPSKTGYIDFSPLLLLLAIYLLRTFLATLFFGRM